MASLLAKISSLVFIKFSSKEIVAYITRFLISFDGLVDRIDRQTRLKNRERLREIRSANDVEGRQEIGRRFRSRTIESIGNHPHPPCLHEKTKKERSRKIYNSRSLFLSLSFSLIFSLALSLCLWHSFSRTDTHAQTRESRISLLPSSGSPLVLPCVKRNFLKLLDGSLPSSFLKADSRMEANYSELRRHANRHARAFWLLYFNGEIYPADRGGFIERTVRETYPHVSRYRPKF